MKKILILAPHTDDGELGCGGSVAKLLEEGHEVHYAVFSVCVESVPEGFPKNTLEMEVCAATALLGIRPEHLHVFHYPVRRLLELRQEILEDLILLKQSISPDLVIMPSLHDIHQDHLAIANEGVRAFKGCCLLSYEMIWNNLTFDTVAFVKLEDRHIAKKVDALKQYKSQQGIRNYMSEEFIRSLATTRGVQIGAEYAETFEVVRWIM